MGEILEYIKIPASGLRIDGVEWPAGVREMRDAGWYKLLKAAGATNITYEEYKASTTTEEDDADADSTGDRSPDSEPVGAAVKRGRRNNRGPRRTAPSS